MEIGIDIASDIPGVGVGGTLMSLQAAVSSCRRCAGAFCVDAVVVHAASSKPHTKTPMISRFAYLVIIKHFKHRVLRMISEHRAKTTSGNPQ